jgi:acetoin utilization deacetylase AcuC-like enzyme
MHLPIVYHPDYVSPLPDGHRFPMPKFRRVYETLLRENIVTLEQVRLPKIASRETVEIVHHADYVKSFCEGTLEREAQRRIGLPWSPQLVKRTLTAVGGTILTAELALKYGVACNTAGGTHHAYPDFGSGFCIFNDLAIAARLLQASGAVRKILIVDLDVHQGDGTASIFQTDPTVFTFSMHCEKNFPFRKQQSDLDIALPVDTADAAYLHALETHLPYLLTAVNPDLVLYDAGVDPHKDDQLGKLALTTNGLFHRDLTVLRECATHGIPVACVVGGGYDTDLNALAIRHSMLFRAAGAVVGEW